jgi:hypothetical protein
VCCRKPCRFTSYDISKRRQTKKAQANHFLGQRFFHKIAYPAAILRGTLYGSLPDPPIASIKPCHSMCFQRSRYGVLYPLSHWCPVIPQHTEFLIYTFCIADLLLSLHGADNYISIFPRCSPFLHCVNNAGLLSIMVGLGRSSHSIHKILHVFH